MFFQIHKQAPQNKMIRPDEGSVFFFLITISFLAMQFAISAIGFFMFGDDPWPRLMGTIASIVLHIIFILLYYFLVIRRKRFLRYGFSNRLDNGGQTNTKASKIIRLSIICALGVLIAAVSFVAFYMPPIWFNSLLDLIAYGDYGFSQMGPYFGIANSVLLGIMVIALAPISEELIFRGVLLSGLSRVTKPYKAVLLTALAFTFFHMNPMATIYQFIMGVVIGFAVIVSRKLLVGIVIHAASNIISFTIHMVSIYSLQAYYPYPAPFNVGFNSIIEYLRSGVGVAVAIALIACGAGLIYGILFLIKKFTPKELELPPLNEPVVMDKQTKDMFDALSNGMGDILGRNIDMNDGMHGANKGVNFFNVEVNMGNRQNPNQNIDPFAPSSGDPLDPFSASVEPPKQKDLFDETPNQDFKGYYAMVNCESCGQQVMAQEGSDNKCQGCGTPVKTPEYWLDKRQNILQDAFGSKQNNDPNFVEDPMLTKMRADSRRRATWRFFWISVAVGVIMWTMQLVGTAVGCS